MSSGVSDVRKDFHLASASVHGDEAVLGHSVLLKRTASGVFDAGHPRQIHQKIHGRLPAPLGLYAHIRKSAVFVVAYCFVALMSTDKSELDVMFGYLSPLRLNSVETPYLGLSGRNRWTETTPL